MASQHDADLMTPLSPAVQEQLSLPMAMVFLAHPALIFMAETRWRPIVGTNIAYICKESLSTTKHRDSF